MITNSNSSAQEYHYRYDGDSKPVLSVTKRAIIDLDQDEDIMILTDIKSIIITRHSMQLQSIENESCNSITIISSEEQSKVTLEPGDEDAATLLFHQIVNNMRDIRKYPKSSSIERRSTLKRLKLIFAETDTTGTADEGVDRLIRSFFTDSATTSKSMTSNSGAGASRDSRYSTNSLQSTSTFDSNKENRIRSYEKRIESLVVNHEHLSQEMKELSECIGGLEEQLRMSIERTPKIVSGRTISTQWSPRMSAQDTGDGSRVIGSYIPVDEPHLHKKLSTAYGSQAASRRDEHSNCQWNDACGRERNETIQTRNHNLPQRVSQLQRDLPLSIPIQLSRCEINSDSNQRTARFDFTISPKAKNHHLGMLNRTQRKQQIDEEIEFFASIASKICRKSCFH